MIENRDLIEAMGKDDSARKLALEFLTYTAKYKYSYNFSWMGRPIIQVPQDMLVVQELIWNIQPDLIIETGIAHGGSLIFSASILELIGGEGKVLGVDIEIRPHNRKAIEEHRMFHRIEMIEGSSIDPVIVEQVHRAAEAKSRIMVLLDSNHTHEHVLKELQAYQDLVTRDSYLIVFDTIVEDLPVGSFPDRPWDKGDNPKTAVWEFLKTNDRFVIDKEVENKILITVAPDGFLKCIKD